MMDRRRPWAAGSLLAVLFVGLMLSGCPSGSKSQVGYLDEDEGPDDTVPAWLEPFEAPTLEELNEKAKWEDRPVIDSMAAYRELKKGQPELVSVAEALKMRNNSTEDNEKILSALSRPAPSDSAVNYDAEFQRHLGGDINSTNPLLTSSTSDSEVNGLTGVGFFSFDWNLEPFAPSETVVSWQTSADKLYDKVVIRDDLFWSNGKPITAYDVVFSYQTIMNPDVPVPAVRTGMDKIAWIKAYDAKTFVICHKESLATNVWNCNFPIIPRSVYRKSIAEDPTLIDLDYHQKLEREPVVGGAYQIVKRVKGQEIVLERRDEWFMHNGKQVRDKPYYKQVRFRVIEDSNTARLALNEGKLDTMELQPRQWEEQTNDDAFYKLNTKVRGVQWVYYYFGWNQDVPFFSDARVRKAMSYAVNYDQILNKLCYGLYEQSTGEFAEGNWVAPLKPRTPYQQDLKKAEALLIGAGWVDTDGDGVREKKINGQTVKFEFSIMCSNEQLRIDICTSLAESLSRLGVVCKVQPTEFTVMQERAQSHKFQAMFGGWGTGTDPSTLENLWKTKETRNYTNYSNKRVDELFAEGQRELNQEKRAEIYREIDGILWEDQPYTWLYYRSAFYGFNKKSRGYMFSPRGPFSYSPGFSSVWTTAAP